MAKERWSRWFRVINECVYRVTFTTGGPLVETWIDTGDQTDGGGRWRVLPFLRADDVMSARVESAPIPWSRVAPRAA